ncbi:MAG: arginine deiminase-related protein [Candidatus Hydrogenedentales bacterium]
MPTPPPQILMCPPDFYGVEYEINPWMSTERKPDHAAALAQHTALADLLQSSGVEVKWMEPVPFLPDLVFTANAAMIYRDAAILARFRHPQRQGEEPHFQRWLSDAGFNVLDPPGRGSFEGAGDALFCGDTLYAGYRIRSDATLHQKIGELLDVRVIPLELVDPYYYHLDTCFCPLAPGVAVYYPTAFDDYGRRALAAQIDQLIEVTPDEAARFACNAVVVGQRVITNTGCDRLHAELTSRGYEPHATPLDEFVKAGGSAKCLTLRLDGEDAAAWKS